MNIYASVLSPDYIIMVGAFISHLPTKFKLFEDVFLFIRARAIESVKKPY